MSKFIELNHLNNNGVDSKKITINTDYIIMVDDAKSFGGVGGSVITVNYSQNGNNVQLNVKEKYREVIALIS